MYSVKATSKFLGVQNDAKCEVRRTPLGESIYKKKLVKVYLTFENYEQIYYF